MTTYSHLVIRLNLESVIMINIYVCVYISNYLKTIVQVSDEVLGDFVSTYAKFTFHKLFTACELKTFNQEIPN